MGARGLERGLDERRPAPAVTVAEQLNHFCQRVSNPPERALSGYGLMRVTVPSWWLAVHTEPAPKAIPIGSSPTGMARPTTRPLSGSICETVLSFALATHTEPSPALETQTEPNASTTPRGPSPTWIGSPMTSEVEESMRLTVSSPWLATHTLSLPTKTPIGSLPTPIGVPTTVAEARSMRLTLSSPELVTHTSCLPSEMPLGFLPTGIVPITTGSGSLSTRRTLLSPDEAIQVTFLAPATPSGALPTASGSPIVSLVFGSMRRNVPSL